MKINTHPYSFFLLFVTACVLPGLINDGITLYDSKQYAPLADSTEFAIQNAYSFESPIVAVNLAKELKEISGITPFDEHHLAAIQDEQGKIFQIRMDTGALVDDDRFYDNGDYEDLVKVGNTFYALQSDGDIFEATGWPVKKKDTVKYETLLEARHDTEGLAYDGLNNRLLIACKEYAGKGLNQKRAIYAFDLTTKEVVPDPAYVIDLRVIDHHIPDNPLNRALRKLAAPLADIEGFKPSAIAIHPLSGHIFVLSSVRKIMIALHPDGAIEAAWRLPEELFRQPEGLSFLPNGDLFISNEGAGKSATLLRFAYNQ